jgi:hypothetical protein
VSFELTAHRPSSSSVITYTVGDTQYVAVVTGFSNFHIRGSARNYAALRKSLGKPEDTSPHGGPAIWVFAR